MRWRSKRWHRADRERQARHDRFWQHVETTQRAPGQPTRTAERPQAGGGDYRFHPRPEPPPAKATEWDRRLAALASPYPVMHTTEARVHIYPGRSR